MKKGLGLNKIKEKQTFDPIDFQNNSNLKLFCLSVKNIKYVKSCLLKRRQPNTYIGKHLAIKTNNIS